MQTYFLFIYLLIVNDRCKVPVCRCLLVVFVFSCLLKGRLNGSPIPTTTLSSSRIGLMTVQPPTSPGQNSEPSMYSRYWMAYVSVPFSRSTVENRSNSSSADVNHSPSSAYDNHRASPSADPSSDRRRQSISSHDQRLSPPSDYGEEITTYSLYPSVAVMGSPSSSNSDLRVRSSGDSDPGISSSWRPIIGFNDQKIKKDRGSPMILFDEHGEMHRDYYTPFTTHDDKYK